MATASYGLDHGRPTSQDRNQPRKAVFQLEQSIDATEFQQLIFRMNQSHGGTLGNQRHSNIAGCFRFSVTDDADAKADPLPAAVREIVSRDVDSWDDGDWDAAFAYWRTTRQPWAATNAEIDKLLADYPAGTSQYVVSERHGSDRRTTYRMDRGNFLSLDERIEPHTPDFLHPVRAGAPANRLTFARWLVDRQSPTTARALVNRVWQAYFGTGIVETAEDLGSQAPPASHPELLDWLAVEFMDSQWSLKHLHRLIVSSATYRQSSIADPTLRSADPYNRWLARGPRVRVEAEVVRDIALAASGLLNREVGGPCVYPPAPEFLFLPPASYGVKEWFAGEGPGNYRRSLYVQAYRSAPYPTMHVFDAPNGDAACTRRTRSNTPLQALTLLNEPQLVSCARALARRLVESQHKTDRGRIELAFRLLLSRAPTENEIATVAKFLETCRSQIASDIVEADVVANIDGASSAGDAEELAIWTLASRTLLNLDETITKQ